MIVQSTPTTAIPLVDLHAQYRTIRTEIDSAVAQVIAESAFVGTAGNRFVQAFENEFAAYTGARHALAVANGTAALHLICAAAGLGPADEVIVPSMTFVATANAIAYTGAAVNGQRLAGKHRFVDC